MNFYIAARFSRRPEAHALAKKLIMLGHGVTSRWVRPDSDHVVETGLSEQAADSERERFAIEDSEDVRACDYCVSLMEEPRNNSRGGRHVEFGIAIGLGKRLAIIGPRETVFHHLPKVIHFESQHEFLASVIEKEDVGAFYGAGENKSTEAFKYANEVVERDLMKAKAKEDGV